MYIYLFLALLLYFVVKRVIFAWKLFYGKIESSKIDELKLEVYADIPSIVFAISLIMFAVSIPVLYVTESTLLIPERSAEIYVALQSEPPIIDILNRYVYVTMLISFACTLLLLVVSFWNKLFKQQSTKTTRTISTIAVHLIPLFFLSLLVWGFIGYLFADIYL